MMANDSRKSTFINGTMEPAVANFTPVDPVVEFWEYVLTTYLAVTLLSTASSLIYITRSFFYSFSELFDNDRYIWWQNTEFL